MDIDLVLSLDCKCKPPNSKSICIPIKDYSIEPLKNSGKAIRLLWREHLLKGKRIYVHCRAGCGRTGTIIISYLILFHNKSLEDSLSLYYSKRFCGPETWEQHKFLDTIWRLVKKGLDPIHILELIEESSDLGEFIGKSIELIYSKD